MSIIHLVDFFLHYQVKTSFTAFLRVITCGYITFFIAWIIKDALYFSHPNKIFSGKDYISINKNKCGQISLFNIFPDSILAQKLIFILFFVFGVMSTIGLFTNISILFFSIFFISIQSRIFPIVSTGGDSISRMLLLALLFTDCGSKYSLDYLLKISSNLSTVDGFGIRVIQMTVCGAYFTSALFKINDYFWVRGEALRNAMFSLNWGRRLFINFFNKQIVYKPMNYSIMFFQLFSPILFYLKETRLLAIIFGILMHLGIIIFMRLGFFGPIMVISVMYFTNQYFK
jgi:hypothetical protein